MTRLSRLSKKHSKSKMKVSSSKHFSKEELQCPCCYRCEMDPYFLDKLENLRWLVREPLVVTSGFRCRIHNKDIGGYPQSYHLTGQAVDIAIVDSRHRRRLLELAFEVGFGGIGLQKTFMHLDNRNTNGITWLY